MRGLGVAGAVHQLFARVDAFQLRSQLLLGSGCPAFCGACLLRRHGRTPSGDRVLLGHRLAGDVPHVGGAGPVHWRGAVVDAAELRSQLLPIVRTGSDSAAHGRTGRHRDTQCHPVVGHQQLRHRLAGACAY